ncbi:hypothetical protein BLA29_010403 [Euroglyphus maynei]|uniref:Uncharacterized protein n=1 Tax=Euroglyphus maynei TaxID=6958 RepID=A0A1Y3AUW6_EURMA|nr:hypothetical protein BLA29_010403 [Euroglyphus maynei]
MFWKTTFHMRKNWGDEYISLINFVPDLNVVDQVSNNLECMFMFDCLILICMIRFKEMYVANNTIIMDLSLILGYFNH